MNPEAKAPELEEGVHLQGLWQADLAHVLAHLCLGSAAFSPPSSL